MKFCQPFSGHPSQFNFFRQDYYYLSHFLSLAGINNISITLIRVKTERDQDNFRSVTKIIACMIADKKACLIADKKRGGHPLLRLQHQ